MTLSEFNHTVDASSAASIDMEWPTKDVAYFECGSIGDGDSISNTNQTQDCHGDFDHGTADTTGIRYPSSTAHKKRKAYCLKSGESSWVWSHYKKQPANKQFAFFLLCQKDTFTVSTTVLECYLIISRIIIEQSIIIILNQWLIMPYQCFNLIVACKVA
jgi:hypothetical protein